MAWIGPAIGPQVLKWGKTFLMRLLKVDLSAASSIQKGKAGGHEYVSHTKTISSGVTQYSIQACVIPRQRRLFLNLYGFSPIAHHFLFGLKIDHHKRKSVEMHS